ncbi:Alpha/Beta hydrolase protein [Mycena rebaudengoi]|nr:Alpha/Beta hydrolase protein [Mycena rebaudengoi]
MPNSPMLLTLLSLTSGLVAASASSPIVALPYATFQGINDGNLAKFLGIPFSRPVARFDLPTPPQRLHGVQNATAFGAACPQQAFSPIPVFPLGAANYSAISEDCLTINVFKPSSASPKAKLPVFVVHPGGFEVGNSVDTDVVPVVKRSMAIGEPVIVVTPKLSPFGFLAGKEAAAAGITNLGLRDQIFALQWVQQHISAFGGDPTRVVVGGISAGAISVGMLLLSNHQHSNTLFHGAFMVSGSPFSVPTIADGQPFYDELVVANNCTGSRHSLQCLKNVPFDSFMATVNKTRNLFSFSSGNNAWRPRLDGDVIVQDPLISVSDGSFAKIPIVTGDDDDEGTTNAEFLDYINSNYIPLATRAQIQKLGLLYPDDPTQVRDTFSNSPRTLTEPEFKRLAAFQGDHFFVAHRRFFLEHASGRQNTWSYLIKRGKSIPFLGAVHGGDIGIWFPTNSNDTIGADILVNFINTLDPNRSAASQSGARLPVLWPKWKSASRALLTLSDPAIVNITTDNFRADAMRYLSDLLLKEALAKK